VQIARSTSDIGSGVHPSKTAIADEIKATEATKKPAFLASGSQDGDFPRRLKSAMSITYIARQAAITAIMIHMIPTTSVIFQRPL
jgi:hypothetical protein